MLSISEYTQPTTNYSFLFLTSLYIYICALLLLCLCARGTGYGMTRGTRHRMAGSLLYKAVRGHVLYTSVSEPRDMVAGRDIM